MSGTRKRQHDRRPAEEEQAKPAMLKDLLDANTVARLKERAEALKHEEAEIERTRREQAELARREEQKRKENDFEYLLNNSDTDWKKYK